MNKKQKKMLYRILSTVVLMAAFHFIPVSGIFRFILYLIPYLLIGYDILLSAGKGIINRQVFDENFLMAVATIGAIIIAVTGEGDYVEAVAVMLFYQIGELFQSYAVGKSRKNISELMDIRPDYANIIKDGALIQIDPEEIAIGTTIIINPGEKIPLDGIILEGSSTLNTSALTGESLPKEVTAGDSIVSGCINLTGVLFVKTTKIFEESTVAKILDLVENASFRKAKTENFISRFAKYYTPAVCYAALALAIFPSLVTSDWGMWFYRALTFLVISCPCALVISIPLTFFAGIGGAGKAGILVKGANYLEALSKTGYVVFDKTGTLTQGVFEVTGMHHVSMAGEQLLEYAALAESASSHPISKSLQRAYGKKIDHTRIKNVQEISGKGVLATVDGIPVAAGNFRLMEELQISYKDCDTHGTIVHVAVNNIYAGHIIISDQIKTTSKTAISSLKSAGVLKTIMLTGDTSEVAEDVASSLGIDEVHSELLPADKVTKVEALLAQKTPRKNLAFVGDGINDAPVLSRADIGIAMGAMGSDAAIEAADVVLMDDDPMKIVSAIRISRRCMSIVYQNIIFALGVKGICLILGALGIANMWLAIFADVGVMVLAVLNAIRALHVKKNH